MGDFSENIRLVERSPYRKGDSAVVNSLPPLHSNVRVLHFDCLCLPQDRAELWLEQDERAIDQLTILYAGHGQSKSSVIETYDDRIGCDTMFTHISNPKNIEQAGLEITKFLDRADAEMHPIICIDSLSTILQYVSLTDTIEFTRHCISLFERYEAIGRFSFIPRAHTEGTTSTIKSLFA